MLKNFATDRPSVSIHILSYNQEAFIAEAIESALAQDYSNLELVISDDASTDGSPTIISRFRDMHPDKIIALLNKDNAGVTGNYQRALRACRGELIAFLGGDDLMLPGKISAQVAWFQKRRERVLCGHQVETFYDDGSVRPHPLQRRLRRGFGAAEIIENGAFATSSIMIRADQIPPHGFEESLPQVSDYMMWVEVLAGGGEFGYIRGTYGRYRRHSANVSNNFDRTIADTLSSLELIAARYPEYKESCRIARGRFVHFPSAQYLLGQGRKKEARAELLKAIRLQPGFPTPWLWLVRTLL